MENNYNEARDRKNISNLRDNSIKLQKREILYTLNNKCIL